MQKIAKFYKVSFEQYLKDATKLYHLDEVAEKAGFSKEEMEMVQKSIWGDIKLPTRSTAGSAGYDFHSTANFELKPGEAITIPTGVRAEMESGWVLLLAPRSGLGFKYHAMLANTIGVIDEDYAYSDNEGHIMIKIVNRGGEKFSVKEGDRIAQGMFFPYGITTDDDVTSTRNGGFGSTGA